MLSKNDVYIFSQSGSVGSPVLQLTTARLSSDGMATPTMFDMAENDVTWTMNKRLGKFSASEVHLQNQFRNTH